MILVRKPPVFFKGQMLLKYNGKNQEFFQKSSLLPIKIFDNDYSISEELVVTNTMYDGTEIKFSMLSSNLFVKKEGEYQLMEGQNFCSFELFKSNDIIVFDGFISYENFFSENFNFKEDFSATIITQPIKSLIDIWEKDK